MMDQRINSAVYVKVLKRIHEFPTEHWPKKGNGRSHEAIEKIFDLSRNRTSGFDRPLHY